MLLCTRTHFIKSLEAVLAGQEGPGSEAERKARGEEMQQRIKDYATDEAGKSPHSEVWSWTPSEPGYYRATAGKVSDDAGGFKLMATGKQPRKGQRMVYVDGGFDLFSSGHIEFLRQVAVREEELGKKRHWYASEAIAARIEETGEDYDPAFVVLGVHDDEVINYFKGVNYPIMNIFERGLCVLQCKYVHAVIFSAPFVPTSAYLKSLPYGLPSAVYHGPTSFMPSTEDPYDAARKLELFVEIQSHDFAHVNAGEIVDRILKSRALYEERQRVKGVKGLGEDAVLQREILEAQARATQEERIKKA
jgi:ethanolamine-phosphate cytidylyltransferase